MRPRGDETIEASRSSPITVRFSADLDPPRGEGLALAEEEVNRQIPPICFAERNDRHRRGRSLEEGHQARQVVASRDVGQWDGDDTRFGSFLLVASGASQFLIEGGSS